MSAEQQLQAWACVAERLQADGLEDAAKAEDGLLSLLQEIRLERGTVMRARGLLAVYGRVAGLVSAPAALDDLRLARRVFRSNQRWQEEARCLQMIAVALRERGAMTACVAVVRHTLMMGLLSMSERADVAHTGVQAQMALLQFDDADIWAQRYIRPYLTGAAQATDRQCELWLGLCQLHLQQYERALARRSVYTLDLSADHPPDTVLAGLCLDKARQSLTAAAACAQGTLARQQVQMLDMVMKGRDGDLASARAVFDELRLAWAGAPAAFQVALQWHFAGVLRDQGVPEAALRVLGQGLELARRHQADHWLPVLLFTMAQLAQEQGRAAQAAECYEAFIQLHASALRNSVSWFTDAEDLATFGPPPDPVAMQPAPLTARPGFLQRALDLLAANDFRPIDVDSVARSVHVSRRTLEQAVRKFEDKSLLELMRDRRMGIAMHRVRTTDLPLQELAHALGYQSGGSFARDFKKVFGLAPSAVRSGLDSR